MSKELIEKNVLIAEWLDFKYEYCSNSKWWFSKDGTVQCNGDEELRFHYDSNWQWDCLEKISIIEGITIEGVFSQFDISINSKEDLFNGIVNYIRSK